MSLFASCLVNKKDSSTQYSQEEAYSKTCFSCCLGFKTRGNRTGVIRLMNTMDDYLNQPSPVSIEALLAEQEEELDQYYDQTDDEDSFHGPSIHAKTKGSFYEDDAESLSEHRISAILDDGPVMNAGGRVFAIKPRQEEETIVCQMETHASQELVQLDTIPTPFKQYTFPATHLTKASYSPSPPMLIHHDTRQDSIPQPIPSLSNTSSLDKSSVVAAAQSLLGDKLDDFTEKLALIKKNIISSVEDDPQGSMSRPKSESLSEGLEKALDTLLPKFKKPQTINESSSLNHESEEEELFDFSKMVTLGKNVRTFSGDMMDNGIRILNSISSRIKDNEQE